MLKKYNLIPIHKNIKEQKQRTKRINMYALQTKWEDKHNKYLEDITKTI